MSILELTLRIIVSFSTLLILTRIIGRKEISQLTFFNFVSAISIGTISASFAIDPSLSIRNGLLALVGWTIVTLTLGFLEIKSKKMRKLIVGEPLVLIRSGKIMEKALKKSRLDTDSLNSLLRKKNVFSITEVDYAIFETDGSLSVLKKLEKHYVTKQDMNVFQSPVTEISIPLPLISDGQIDTENLTKLKQNKEWLIQQLQLTGVDSISDVFYAEVQQDGTLFIDKKDKMVH